MWIRNQNGTILMDCDSFAVKDHSGKYEVITLSGKSGISISLGTYSTKEKALKVLDQIQYNMEPFEHEPTMVFQMPADEDVEV